jgi:hypothetical protein
MSSVYPYKRRRLSSTSPPEEDSTSTSTLSSVGSPFELLVDNTAVALVLLGELLLPELLEDESPPSTLSWAGSPFELLSFSSLSRLGALMGVVWYDLTGDDNKADDDDGCVGVVAHLTSTSGESTRPDLTGDDNKADDDGGGVGVVAHLTAASGESTRSEAAGDDNKADDDGGGVGVVAHLTSTSGESTRPDLEGEEELLEEESPSTLSSAGSPFEPLSFSSLSRLGALLEGVSSYGLAGDNNDDDDDDGGGVGVVAHLPETAS